MRRKAGKRRSRVSKKISHLRHENVPQKQAVAMSLNMEREGRITESGGYRRVGKKSHTRKSKRARRRGGRR